MDYGDCEVMEVGVTLLLGKSHCPRTFKWRDPPTGSRYSQCSTAAYEKPSSPEAGYSF